MSELLDIANRIRLIIQSGLDEAGVGIQVRYGLATTTAVITESKAVGVCLVSKVETPISYEKIQQTVTYQVWAFAQPTPPSIPADAEEAVIELMEIVENALRANPTLGDMAISSSLSGTDFNYEQIQAGIYAATAITTLTVVRHKEIR